MDKRRIHKLNLVISDAQCGRDKVLAREKREKREVEKEAYKKIELVERFEENKYKKK